jgi:ribA/ribD-fused uncharacterized protein
VILFNSMTPDWAWLSNFSPHPVTLPELGDFPTAEHAYQALNSSDPAVREEIRRADSPSAAKALGAALVARPDWELARVEAMRRVLEEKFRQHPELAERLQATGDEALMHLAPWEAPHPFWGVDDQLDGQNTQGKLLEELRTVLRTAS